jgi:diguanylate cyclase (GGDEF)-like protein
MDRLVSTDLLTGILNRRGIDDVLATELRHAVKKKQALSVVAIDLDGLRTVNNTHGHTAGDRLLESATRHWREGLRRRDSVGRTGGDEFLVVLPSTTIEQAVEVVRRLAAESPAAWSAGIAMAKPGDSIQSILERADSRMYADKAARARSGVPEARVSSTVHS